jgi:hypothetical protein
MFNLTGKGAATMVLLFIKHQHIVAANHLAPMYWCCKYVCKKIKTLLCAIIDASLLHHA